MQPLHLAGHHRQGSLCQQHCSLKRKTIPLAHCGRTTLMRKGSCSDPGESSGSSHASQSRPSQKYSLQPLGTLSFYNSFSFRSAFDCQVARNPGAPATSTSAASTIPYCTGLLAAMTAPAGEIFQLSPAACTPLNTIIQQQY